MNIYHFRDLRFTVVATPHDYHVDYIIYEIDAVDEHGSPLWHEKGVQSSPAPVNSLEKAEVFARGWVKWDGCSNWYFEEQDRTMLHGCDREDLTRLGEILAKCWDLNKDLCLHWVCGRTFMIPKSKKGPHD